MTISVLVIHVNKQFLFLLARQDVYPIFSYQILVMVSQIVSCSAFILHHLSSQEIGRLCGRTAVYMQKDKDMRSSLHFIVFVGALKNHAQVRSGSPCFQGPSHRLSDTWPCYEGECVVNRMKRRGTVLYVRRSFSRPTTEIIIDRSVFSKSKSFP
jgi:hypothetical protein